MSLDTEYLKQELQKHLVSHEQLKNQLSEMAGAIKTFQALLMMAYKASQEPQPTTELPPAELPTEPNMEEDITQ